MILNYIACHYFHASEDTRHSALPKQTPAA